MRDLNAMICDNLRSARRKSKLTQQEVATKLGVEQKTYSNWERGRTNISIKQLVELETLFKIDLFAVVSHEKNQQRSEENSNWRKNYAGLAMQTLLTNLPNVSYNEIAVNAFMIADEMMKRI